MWGRREGGGVINERGRRRRRERRRHGVCPSIVENQEEKERRRKFLSFKFLHKSFGTFLREVKVHRSQDNITVRQERPGPLCSISHSAAHLSLVPEIKEEMLWLRNQTMVETMGQTPLSWGFLRSPPSLCQLGFVKTLDLRGEFPGGCLDVGLAGGGSQFSLVCVGWYLARKQKIKRRNDSTEILLRLETLYRWNNFSLTLRPGLKKELRSLRGRGGNRPALFPGRESHVENQKQTIWKNK